MIRYRMVQYDLGPVLYTIICVIIIFLIEVVRAFREMKQTTDRHLGVAPSQAERTSRLNPRTATYDQEFALQSAVTGKRYSETNVSTTHTSLDLYLFPNIGGSSQVHLTTQ